MNRFKDSRLATLRSEIYILSPATRSLNISLGSIPYDIKR